MINLPNRETRMWAQPNNSDLFGTVSLTKNIDFDKAGYLSLAKRSRAIYDGSDDANFGHPVSITRYTGAAGTTDIYYVITNSGKGYIVNGSTFVTTEDTGSDVPTFDNLGRSDGVVWQSLLYVSAETAIHRAAGTGASTILWDSGSFGTLSNGGGGPLCVFVNKNALAVGDGNTVKLYSGAYPSESLLVTLTLPSEYWVTSMAWSNNYLFIGTRHRGNDNAHLFVWDGADTTWNNSFSVGTHRIDSVVAFEDSVALITSEGQLLRFNGGGFSELANLPIYFKGFEWDVTGAGGGSTARLGRVLHRGMVVEGGIIFINLSGLINQSTNDATAAQHLQDFPSGIWCYDPDVGIYQRYTLTGDARSKTNVVTTANVATGTGIITVAGATVPATGTPVLYDDGTGGSGTLLAPLTFRSKYYVIRLTDTTMKLATTYANAIAGTAITLTATGNDLQYFVFIPNRDFGGSMNSVNGAVCLLKKGPDPGAVASDGQRLMFSGFAGETTTDLVSVLNVAADSQENRGWIVTPKVLSARITDNFSNLTVKYKGIKTAEDLIRVKYRNIERFDSLTEGTSLLAKTATWVDESSFTTTADLSSAEVGDEIEFGRGTGAGYIVHILTLVNNSGTWTVTLAEDVQNVTAADTALFYISNWEKAGDVTTSDNGIFTTNNSDTYDGEGGSKTFAFNKKGEWVQFKIELRGEDVSIYDILINNKTFADFTK